MISFTKDPRELSGMILDLDLRCPDRPVDKLINYYAGIFDKLFSLT